MSLRKAQVAVNPVHNHCLDHGSKQVDHFCKDCNETGCSKCMQTKHNGHKWCDIDDIVDEKREDLKTEIETVRNSILPKLIEEKARLEESLGETDTEDIDQQIDGMIILLNRYREELKTKVAISDAEKTDIQTTVTGFIDDISNLEQILGSSERSMTSQSKLEMIQAYVNLTKAAATVSDASKAWFSIRKPRFLKGDIDEAAMLKMVGTLESDQDHLSSDFVDMTLMDTSSAAVKATVKATLTDGEKILRVAVSNGKIYTNETLTEVVKVFDVDGHYIKKVTTDYVQDFSSDELGNIYTCNVGKKWISKLTTDDQIVDLFNTSPLYPHSICLTQSGDILVALVDVGVSMSDKCKQTYIARMDVHGREKRRYQYEEDGTRLFQYAMYISENRNKDLLVLDVIGKNKHRLYILNDEGHIKHAYNGTSRLMKNFLPVGICCDSYSRILLADLSNHAIHLLNDRGELLQLLLTEKDGLENPYSLALNNDLLCIGTMKGKLLVAEYKY